MEIKIYKNHDKWRHVPPTFDTVEGDLADDCGFYVIPEELKPRYNDWEEILITPPYQDEEYIFRDCLCGKDTPTITWADKNRKIHYQALKKVVEE